MPAVLKSYVTVVSLIDETYSPTEFLTAFVIVDIPALS